MAVIPLNDLKPGMVLSKPVLNFNGNLLLKKGVKVTAKHISILKAWGIRQVEVDSPGEPTDHTPQVDPQLLAELEERMRMKFFGTLDNEVMMEIMRVAEKQAIAKLSQESSGESSVN